MKEREDCVRVVGRRLSWAAVEMEAVAVAECMGGARRLTKVSAIANNSVSVMSSGAYNITMASARGRDLG